MAQQTETRHPDDAETYAPWSADAEPVEVAPGLFLPSVVNMAVPDESWASDWQKAGVDMRLEGHFVLEDYRYVLRRLVIEDAGEHGVTGSLLRNVAIRELIEVSAMSNARTRRPDGKLERANLHNFEHVAAGGPTEASLVAVAWVYAVGYSMQMRPTAAVEDALGLKRSTAENWVRRAKDRGYVYAAA